MLKGLFLNTKKAQCSIYESGLMVYNCLKSSDKFSLTYQEIDKDMRRINTDYDFIIFNYHYNTMGWLDTSRLRLKVKRYLFTIVLEVAPNDPFPFVSPKDFDGYLVLDPTCAAAENVFPLPRPLDNIDIAAFYKKTEVPVIGTFGFATYGKGYEKVIEAVCEEFDKAQIRINIPRGDYVPNEMFDAIIEPIKNKQIKEGIKLDLTHNYFSKEELINWCAQNTLNCFLYNRDMPGLSATTDQAIVSRRPLAVSTNTTFRHIHQYIKPYPSQSLKDSIRTGEAAVYKMLEDWSPAAFLQEVEKVFAVANPVNSKRGGGVIYLPVVSFSKKMVKRIKNTLKRVNRKLSTFIHGDN